MNSKGSELDDLLMYKNETVAKTGTMGLKESRNTKLNISCEL